MDQTVPHDQLGQMSLRFIYVNILSEHARHAGHADILREQIDGATDNEVLYQRAPGGRDRCRKLLAACRWKSGPGIRRGARTETRAACLGCPGTCWLLRRACPAAPPSGRGGRRGSGRGLEPAAGSHLSAAREQAILAANPSSAGTQPGSAGPAVHWGEALRRPGSVALDRKVGRLNRAQYGAGLRGSFRSTITLRLPRAKHSIIWTRGTPGRLFVHNILFVRYLRLFILRGFRNIS